METKKPEKPEVLKMATQNKSSETSEYLIIAEFSNEDLAEVRKFLSGFEQVRIAKCYRESNPCSICNLNLNREETSLDEEGRLCHKGCLDQDVALANNEVVNVPKVLWETFTRGVKERHQDPMTVLAQLIHQASEPDRNVEFNGEILVEDCILQTLADYAKQWHFSTILLGPTKSDAHIFAYTLKGTLPVPKFKDFLFDFDQLAWVEGSGLHFKVL